MKILIVDDYADLRRLAIAFVEKLGHVGIVAGDGREAVELYRKEKPDAVLMDILMPVMDGIEALAVILSEDPAARVIFLSVLDEFPEGTPRDIASTFGIHQKPCNIDEMKSILEMLQVTSDQPAITR